MRAAPPRGEPRDPMVLIDHQIKLGLLAIPSPRGQNGTAISPPANDFDAVAFVSFPCVRKTIREPINLMPPLDQRMQVAEGNALRTTTLWIVRIPPVQHQESHGASIQEV